MPRLELPSGSQSQPYFSEGRPKVKAPSQGIFSRSEGAPGNHGCGANGWRKRAWRGKTPEMTGVPHFDSERTFHGRG